MLLWPFFVRSRILQATFCPTIPSAAFPKLQPHACLRHNSSPTSLDWYLRGTDKEPTLHLLVLDTRMLRTAFSEGIMKKELHNHVLVVLFVSTLLFQTSAMGQSTEPSQRSTQVREPIIDVHMHAYAKDDRWTHKVANPITGRAMTATDEQAHMRETLSEMKNYNIVKALVSTDYEAVLRWKAATPDNILASYGFDDPAKVNLEFLRKEHAARRLISIGEIGAQYQGIAPNDPKMEPIYALAEELDIPVGIHIGLSKPGVSYDDSPKYRAALSNPMLLEEVLLRHPKIRLYVMHAGWPMLDQMIALMWAHPQVYVDVAVINWALPREEFHYYLRRLVNAGFGKRIMFGSDQMVWPDAIGRAVEGIESASFLTKEQKRDIFYNNAVSFLRLEKN
jgi:uncharacterized protein